MYAEKLPPHDIDAEEAAVGSILLDSQAILKAIPFIKPDDFYREANKWCYEACLALFERNEAINQITVASELAAKNRLETVGGPAFLVHMASIVPTPLHIEHYARIVQRHAMMRRLIQAAGEIARIGYDGGPDVDESLSRAEDLLFKLRRGQSSRDFVHIRSVLDQYLEESGFRPRPEQGDLPQVPSGFSTIDEILGGLQRSDMIVLAARPGAGKSTLALNIARHAAVKETAKVAIFSLEMSKEQLVQRLLASESGVDSHKLLLGQHTSTEEGKVIAATGVLSEAPIYIDDTPSISVVELRSKARRLHLEVGVDLVIVDYLQLMEANEAYRRRQENRVQEISEISRSLKGLARDLNVPLLAVSQLSRAVEQRPTHTPQLSDLRESGSIEQDADIVMFIYRDDMYYSKEEWEKSHPQDPYPKGIADIIVAKHRHGPTGRVQLFFREKVARFENLQVQKG